MKKKAKALPDPVFGTAALKEFGEHCKSVLDPVVYVRKRKSVLNAARKHYVLTGEGVDET